MPEASRWPVGAAALAVLAWLGVVLWRYQGVQSPEPLAGIALIVAWLAVLSLACLGAGSLAWQLAAARPVAGLDALVVVLALGAGALAAAAAALSLAGLLRPLPLLAVVAVATALGVREVARMDRRPRLRLPPGTRLPALLVVAVAGYTLLVAVTPSPFYDQLHYHLAFPFQWLRHGAIEVFPRHAYSFFPATHGLLFSYGLAALGAGAAQATHWWLGALGVAGAGALAVGLRGPRAGWWTAALLATTASLLQLATWAAADLAVIAFGVAALLMLALASRDAGLARRPGWWLLAGLLVGLSVGCKYLAALTVAVPLGVAVLLLRVPHGGVGRLGRGALVVGGATVAFAPWLLRNAAATGNPLYPFLSSVFATHVEGVTAADVAAVAALIPGTGWARPAAGELLTLTTFAPVGDAGALGPAHLGLLPLALWAIWRGRRSFAATIAVAGAVAVAGWALGPPTGRYLLPAMTVLAVLTGCGVQRAVTAAPRRSRGGIAALLAAVLAWSALGGLSSLELERLGCTLGRGNPDEVMERWASYWPAARVVDERLPADARLLLVGESRAMYLERDVVVDDPFVTPLLVVLAESLPSAPALAAELQRRGITHLLVNHREASRIAALNGRPTYLGPLSPTGSARLEAFFSGCVHRLAEAGPVELLVLAGCTP